MYRSAKILMGETRAETRSLFKSMGYTENELTNRPLIGIVNSWSTLVPGHFNLRELASYVEKGIYRAGGTAVEFGVISACDGIANGHDGMKYILPSREVICNSIEIEAQAHQLDGLILLASCDKIVPGMLMAAARLNIPAILVNGGPMLGGDTFDGRCADATSNDEALGMFKSGRISAEALHQVENSCCPGCGSCSFYGTANTMGCVAEALGMSLPGSALIPAVYAERKQAAFDAGRQICHLVEQGITARDVMDERAIRNAVRIVQTTSGSTNAALHLSAIANEAELPIRVMDVFGEQYPETPILVKVNPSSAYNMEDFYKAGGIPRTMRCLGDLIDGTAMTCTGKTVAENLAAFHPTHPENPEIIRDRAHAYQSSGGVAVLRGNLAELSAITKPGAYAPELRHFTGTARVFDREEAANDAILRGEITPQTILVIRYEGPKGGPGMREMYKAMKYLYGQGLAKSTAVITDGRFSGTNNGCFVGHISPEAAEGGTIALVEDGDSVEIDVDAGILTLHVDNAELERRRQAWKAPDLYIPKGYLRSYARLASSADQGAVLH